MKRLLVCCILFWLQAQAPVPGMVPAPVIESTDVVTQRLYRELGLLEKRIDQHFQTIDKATELFQSNLTRVPTELDKALGTAKTYQEEVTRGLKAEIYEKFRSIEIQLKERDERVLQTASGQKIAVDLALSAQKENVTTQNLNIAAQIAEMKAGFTKQQDALSQLLGAKTDSLDQKLNLMKEQLNLTDGRSRGIGDSWGFVVGLIGIVGVIVSIMLALSFRSTSRHRE